LICLPLFPGVMGNKKFVLEAEEATFSYDCCGIYSGTTRRSYGELGSVDKGYCLCCVGVTSGLTKHKPIFPGCGCNEELVSETVEELKIRMKQRGDTGNIQRAEQTFAEVQHLKQEVHGLRADVTAIMNHLGIAPIVEEPLGCSVDN